MLCAATTFALRPTAAPSAERSGGEKGEPFLALRLAPPALIGRVRLIDYSDLSRVELHKKDVELLGRDVVLGKLFVELFVGQIRDVRPSGRGRAWNR